MNGILPINKPEGMTSYDVIRILKKSGYKGKVGHAGTLDPFASGVLLLLLGNGTKKFAEIQKVKKRYKAVAIIGYKSDTLDKDGVVEKGRIGERLDTAKLRITVNNYMGELDQIVPAYSAAKYKGTPLYKLARSGKEVPIKRKKITVHSIKVVVKDTRVEFDIVCSSGTYIRQLTYDILNDHSTDSYLGKLIRLSVGNFDIDACTSIEDIVTGNWEKYLIT